jgi:hypothetical protein
MKLLIRFFVLTSVNNLPVAKTFVKDELFRAHMTLLMEERVENAVERVQKLATNIRVTTLLQKPAPLHEPNRLD